MKSTSMRTPVLCISLLALAACGKQQAPSQPPPPSVSVVTVQPQNVPLHKDLVGRLSAYRSADVRARVSGLLLKRVYKEGTDVKAGQLLFQIDPAPYKAALASAQGTLAAAQATYVNAHIVADRDRALVGKGYIAKATLDADEATERSSAAQVKEAQASVTTAQVNLSYTNITAPIDGRAGEQQVTEGAIVGSSTSDAGSSATLLTTVDQLDPMYINFTLSATDLDSLQHQQTQGNVSLSDQAATTVQLTLPSGIKYNQTAKLDYSSVIVNQTTGAINMRAVVPNPDNRLLSGMFVTLTANLGELNKVYLVPAAALQRDGNNAYVLVVGQDNKVAQKIVTSDTQYGDNWIVTSGLNPGDQVIVTGVQAATAGATVKPSPWQPNQQQNAPASAGTAPAAGK